MLTGEIRSQIDTIWDAFWSGGIANPLSVIEQITYLLFLRRLDEIQTAKEKAANALGRKIDKPVFDDTPAQQSCRWSKFKHLKPEIPASLADIANGPRRFGEDEQHHERSEKPEQEPLSRSDDPASRACRAAADCRRSGQGGRIAGQAVAGDREA
jgi:hypothetical protein